MSAKAFLKDARAALVEERFQDVIDSCHAVLKADSSSLEAYLFMGKAYFQLAQHAQAEKAYTRAAELNSTAPQPLQGLREVHTASVNDAGLLPVLHRLITMTDDVSKRQGYQRELLDCQERLGEYEAAYTSLHAQCGADVGTWDVDVAARGAELLWRSYEVSDVVHADLPTLLQNVLRGSRDTAAILTAADRLLRCSATPHALVSTAVTVVFPALTTQGIKIPQVQLQWVLTAVEALHTQEGAALYLETHEDVTSLLSQPLPGDLPSYSHIVTNFLPASDATAVFSAACQSAICPALDCLPAPTSAPLPASLLASALFLMSVGRATAALDLLTQHATPPDTITHVVRALTSLPASPLLPDLLLARAEAMCCSLARDPAAITQAKEMFQQAVPQRSDVAWRLRCLQGVAWAFTRQGEMDSAGKVAGKAADLASASAASLSPTQAALHAFWTQAVTARCAETRVSDDEAGSLERAEAAYTAALQYAETAGGAARRTPQIAARVRMWRAGVRVRLAALNPQQHGALATDRTHAFADYRAAAEVESEFRGEALAGLASLLLQGGDTRGAQRCLERAVQLDPTCEAAGVMLCSLLRQAASASPSTSAGDEEARLLEGLVAATEGGATWALKRLTTLHAHAGRHREAVQCLWQLLRGSPQDAVLWEALGASYYDLKQHQAALRAFTKAIELDPQHGQEILMYRHLMCGEVHVATRQIPESEPHFRRALQLDPDNAVVQYSLARALYLCAARHVELGAHGTALAELRESSALLSTAARRDPTLAAVYKLQGDVLQLMATCSTRVFTEGEESDFIGAHLRAINTQIECLRRARRSYAKAVFRQPAAEAAVHCHADAARTLVQEAQLRRAHVSLDEDGMQGNRLRVAATQFLRKVLHVPAAATCADVWHALGAAALDPRVKEYALCRALQLDTSRAATWVALGQLYEEAGETAQANRCYEEARCHDAEDASTWEAMGQQTTKSWSKLHADSGSGRAKAPLAPGDFEVERPEERRDPRDVVMEGRQSRFDAAEIAISLWGGGGFLSNLWRALDATALHLNVSVGGGAVVDYTWTTSGGAAQADVSSLASAERAVDLFPLSPAAQLACGLAWEGQWLARMHETEATDVLTKAERHYRAALILTADPSIPAFNDTALEPNVLEFVVPMHATDAHVDHRQAARVLTELNLARLLVRKGAYEEARELYATLAASAHLPGPSDGASSFLSPSVLCGAWLHNAVACAHARPADAPAALLNAIGCAAKNQQLLGLALGAATQIASRVDGDQALMYALQLSEHVASYVPPSDEAKERMQRATALAWSALLTAAAASSSQDKLSTVLTHIRVWSTGYTTCRSGAVDGAAFWAHHLLKVVAPSDPIRARRALSKAVFLCPYNAALRRQAAITALSANPAAVPSLLNRSVSSNDLHALLPTTEASLECPELLLTLLVTRTATNHVGGEEELQRIVRKVQSAVFAQPGSLHWRVTLAWVQMQAARAQDVDGGSEGGAYRKCLATVNAALSLARTQGVGGAGSMGPGPLRTLVALLTFASDCHMRQGSMEEATRFSDKAVALASRVPPGDDDHMLRNDIVAISHIQRGRCLLLQGKVDAAVAAFSVATGLTDTWHGLAAAFQAASALLSSGGYAAAALQLLESVASASTCAHQLAVCDVMGCAQDQEPGMSGLYVEGAAAAVRSALASGTITSPADRSQLETLTGLLLARLALQCSQDPGLYEALGLRPAADLAAEARRVLLPNRTASYTTSLAELTSRALASAELLNLTFKKRVERAAGHLNGSALTNGIRLTRGEQAARGELQLATSSP